MSAENPFKTKVTTGPRLESKSPEKVASESLFDDLRARLGLSSES